MQRYRQAGIPAATHAGLPSPYLTVIFTLDDPLTIATHPDPAQPGGQYLTLAGGLHAAPAVITHEGRQSGIQVALSPLGARAFLGLPAGELNDTDYGSREFTVLDIEGSRWSFGTYRGEPRRAG